MKRLISIFLFAFCILTAGCFYYPKEHCSADSKKYEIDTKGIGEERLFFNVRDSINGRLDQTAMKLQEMGFDQEVILKYLFTNYDEVVEYLKSYNIAAVDSKIVYENGRVYPTKETSGRAIEEMIFRDMLFEKVLANEPYLTVPFEEIQADSTYAQNINFCNLKSFFKTPINGINQEGRIHNIQEALSRFDEKVVESGEIVSFNEVIGNTTKENGYALAKVIINGKYEDDYGGGVCQAATTLYNALLLAGVDVLEANPHSLKVGYVEGSFDSMVSYGISDLVFKNTTNGPLFIKTSCSSNGCSVSIYGAENEYDIKRRTENIDFDEEQYPKIKYKSAGFLEYYKNGEKQFEKKIRKDNYYKIKNESV